MSVPPDDADAPFLAFPPAAIGDQLDYAFDFAAWLGPLDQVEAAAMTPDAALASGVASIDGQRVTARIGPATAPGVYRIACAVLTSQSRVKAIAATVSVQ